MRRVDVQCAHGRVEGRARWHVPITAWVGLSVPRCAGDERSSAVDGRGRDSTEAVRRAGAAIGGYAWDYGTLGQVSDCAALIGIAGVTGIAHFVRSYKTAAMVQHRRDCARPQ